jgi:hypothetical protein
MISRILAGLLLGAVLLSAQASKAAEAQQKVADDAVADVVARLNDELRNQYPLAEIGTQYVRAVTKAWHGGAYRGLSSCGLAEHLSSDLQATHRDLHLRIWCGEIQDNGGLPADVLGHGFQAVTLDPQLSIALIKTAGPWTLEDEAFEAATHAMGLAAGAKNVVIDVRGNPGGHGEIGYFLASYFLPVGEARAFERGLYRAPRAPDVASTLPYVPGRRLSDAKLFILVDAHTASAAEGFAFGMQQMGRATIVGQTTAGAGIAGSQIDLGHGLTMFMPFKLVAAVDSDATYEGKGVVPERETAPGEEYDTVVELVRKESPDAEPVFVKAAQEEAAKETVALPDPTANLENCQDLAIAEDKRSFSITNRCGRAVTAQYLGSNRPDVVFEYRLGPGDGLTIPLSSSRWCVVAACPEGYYSTVRLTSVARDAVGKGDYLCTRHQP